MSVVLVDTSVWRRFFHGESDARELSALLDEDGAVLVHPFVIGELVLGGISTVQEELFRRLPSADVVSHREVLEFVRRRRIARKGIGWIDAHLVASALASSALIWSADKDLAKVAADLGAGYRSHRH